LPEVVLTFFLRVLFSFVVPKLNSPGELLDGRHIDRHSGFRRNFLPYAGSSIKTGPVIEAGEGDLPPSVPLPGPLSGV